MQVLLVGGAMRMPGVQQLVRNMTGIDAKEFVVDPDEVRRLIDRTHCLVQQIEETYAAQ